MYFAASSNGADFNDAIIRFGGNDRRESEGSATDRLQYTNERPERPPVRWQTQAHHRTRPRSQKSRWTRQRRVSVPKMQNALRRRESIRNSKGQQVRL